MKKAPNLSVIIPTRNEAQNLPLLLSDLGELKIKCEIFIIDSQSSDATKDIAIINGANYLNSPNRNRGLQLNIGAKMAKGDWLLFIHADSRLKKDWSKAINFIFSKPDPQGIYFFKFKVNNKNLLFRFLELFVSLRIFFFKTPYGDQGLLIHRDIFSNYGGYKNIPIMEDIDFIKRIKDKKRLVSLSTSIFTNSRKWEKKNLITQSIINFNLRRKWRNGYSLEKIYKEYYR